MRVRGAAGDAFPQLVADIADDDQTGGGFAPWYRVEAAREEGEARRCFVLALPGDEASLPAMG
jgi:hypothetical protein